MINRHIRIGCVAAVTASAMLAVSVPFGCGRVEEERSGLRVVVTNSYLHSAVSDIAGDGVEVITLTPPGMCPGHFDISPGQVQAMRRSGLLVRFDFQQGLDETLAGLRVGGLEIQAVVAGEGLSIPQTYIEVCGQVAEMLAKLDPENGERYRRRLAELSAETEALSRQVKALVSGSGLTGAAVLSSGHQGQFARWLGLDVVETFPGGDVATLANIRACLDRAGEREIRFVIANRQEGTELARAIAERTGAGTVVFSNFPDTAGAGGFGRMLMENVGQLLQ